jgi:cytochrome P450 PksS
LREEAPVYRTILPDKRIAWLVTRYDDALAALKDERLAKDPLNALPHGKSSRPQWMPGFLKPLARNMLDLDAPDHTRLRNLVHKAFTPRLVEQMRERVQTLCDDLLASAQSNGRLDLIRDYALPLPSTIIAEMLGVPTQDRARFHAWSNSMTSVSSPADMVKVIPRCGSSYATCARSSRSAAPPHATTS